MVDYQLKIMSPDGEIFNDKVIALSLRGAEGDMAILANHVPLVTTVKPGKCVVTLPNEEEMEGTLDGGILNVGSDSVTLLVGNRKLFSK